MTEQPEKAVESAFVSTEGVPTLYSNSVRMALSLFDFHLVFGEIIGFEEESGKTITQPLVKVYLSPQHAKVLANVLNKNVALYEQQFGEIPSNQVVETSIEL